MSKLRCRLCLQEKPLLKRSHIIPEFFYRGMYDRHHQFYKLNVHSVFVEGNRQGMQRLSKGEYEGGLLCMDCDNKILGHGYEDYTATALFSKKPTVQVASFVDHDGRREVHHVRNIDYRQFKLCLLSILWRASISQRPLFQDVQLDEEQEERLRVMLLEGDAGQIEEYPVVVYSFMRDTTVSSDYISQPSMGLIEGKRICRFSMGGLIYDFYVDGFPPAQADVLQKSVISPSNEMKIVELPVGEALRMIGRDHGVPEDILSGVVERVQIQNLVDRLLPLYK